MRFVWDKGKNRQNLAKHKVSFEAATFVFDDSLAISRRDSTEQTEERWLTLGTVGDLIVLLVVHLSYEENGEEVIRMVSARKATPRERRIYEEGE